MNLVQITPGAGGMYCGNCFRDNALVAELRRLGHSTLMVPLYLPMTLDEPDQSRGTPVFFAGVNVYLDQQFAWYRRAPEWLRKLAASPALLRLAGTRAGRTRAAEVGALTVSMLRGEEGNQRRDLDEFTAWLTTQPRPDVICLSNALLLGMARRLRAEVGTRVICMLQGEDAFLDSMVEPHRSEAWATLAARCRDADLFVAASRYFGRRMAERLGIPESRIRVVPNGISLAGYPASADPAVGQPPVGAPANGGAVHGTIGYFARMCRDKGLDLVVEAFVRLRSRPGVGRVRLRVGGGMGPSDEPFVRSLHRRIADAGLAGDVDWEPNLDRERKVAFLRSLDVFSVPARSGEAFGLYVVEALAAGVPVVQPRAAAFPELVEATGGGMLVAPEDPEALACAWEDLFRNPVRRRSLGEAGRRAVFRDYHAARMAENMLAVFSEVAQGAASLTGWAQAAGVPRGAGL